MQTAQDIVAYLLASNGGGAQDGEHSAVRHAVLHGVREVMQCKNWLWHLRTNSFKTGTVQTTGSTTAGSNVINVASTAGFVAGRIVDVSGFDDPVRIVQVREGSVVVDQNAQSTASSIPVKPQQYYNLPYDLKDLDTLSTQTVGTLHCRISPQEWQRLEVNHRGSGEPYFYTIMRSDTHPDRYQVRFVGTPTNPVKVSYTYRVIPKPIKYMGYEKSCRQGTVTVGKVTTTATVTQNSNTIVVASATGLVPGMKLVLSNFPSATQTITSINSLSVTLDAAATASGTNVVVRSEQMRVTGDKTNFPQDCAGAFIRFGSLGMEADSIGSNVPYIMERRIEGWSSSTSLSISSTGVYQRRGGDGEPYEALDFDANEVDISNPSATPVEANTNAPYVTNDYDDINTALPALTKYAITDVVNASPQMYTAVLSACEMWYARLAGKDYGGAMNAFNRDLRIAMENDVVTPISGMPAMGYNFGGSPRTMGWHSDLGQDMT
jgi:hypothetical protein